VIVDEHIEPSEGVVRAGDHGLDSSGVTHVADHALDGAPLGADLRRHGLQVLGAAARDQHLRAARGELARDRGADAGAAAGHDHRLAGDTEGIVHGRLRLLAGRIARRR
jgi:hypothetical protein